MLICWEFAGCFGGYTARQSCLSALFSSRNRLEPGQFQFVNSYGVFRVYSFSMSRCFVRKPQTVFCERPSELYFEVCPCSDVFPFEFV